MKFNIIINNSGYNPYRSPDGRFAPGPNLAKVQQSLGFSLSKDTSVEEINTFFQQFNGQQNYAIAKNIYEKLGFNKQPSVFTLKDYDEGIAVTRAFNPYIGQSRKVLESYRKQLFEGERYFSPDKISVYGTGDYFAIGDHNKYRDYKSSVMAYAKVKGSTRMVDAQDIAMRVKSMRNRKNLLAKSMEALSDYGIMAALSGYEAIINKRANEMVLLDRTKLSKERF